MAKKKRKNLVFGKGSFTDRGGLVGAAGRTIRDTATMPLRGARNLLGIAKFGARTGYKLTDKAINATKSGIKQMNKNSAAAKERRKKLGIGEFKKKPSPKKKDKLTVTVPESARKGVKLDPKFTDGKKSKSSGKTTKSNVFTKHYATGKELGVMTRSDRRRYDKEAAGRTYQSKKRKK